MTSALRIVDKRWATMMVVLPSLTYTKSMYKAYYAKYTLFDYKWTLCFLIFFVQFLTTSLSITLATL